MYDAVIAAIAASSARRQAAERFLARRRARETYGSGRLGIAP